MQPLVIKESAGLPVEFPGQVRTAIEIGMDLSIVPDDEGRHRRVALLPLETPTVARVDKRVTAADQAFSCSHRRGSAVPPQPKTINSWRLAMTIRFSLLLQGAGERLEFRWQRCAQCHLDAGGGMRKAKLRGVQEHALEPPLCQLAVEFEVAVLVVSEDRKPQMGEVDPDLMRAPGVKLSGHQREAAERIFPPEYRALL